MTLSPVDDITVAEVNASLAFANSAAVGTSEDVLAARLNGHCNRISVHRFAHQQSEDEHVTRKRLLVYLGFA